MDELPSLFNVLKGDMSIVGPRPEVAKYVHLYAKEFDAILRLRPGLSDFASIKYRDEEAILAAHQNPENYYLNVILPDKLNLASLYIEGLSLNSDLHIIKDTLKILLRIDK
jgi:lipopolysaccharide/colanic/teichoic acid biosynthesis glycosyltransferase